MDSPDLDTLRTRVTELELENAKLMDALARNSKGANAVNLPQGGVIEQNFRNLFNAIDSFLFILDNEGVILSVNDTVLERLKYTTDELVGKSVLVVHPDDRKEEVEKIIRLILAGEEDCCPIPLKTIDGKLIEVETRFKLGAWDNETAIFGVSKDVTDLRISEERFAMAFEKSPALKAFSDLDTGAFIQVNQTFLDVLGYKKEEVLGKKSVELLGIDQEQRKGIVEKLKERRELKNVRLSLRDKAGQRHTMVGTATILSIAGVDYNFTSLMDITSLTTAESELKRSQSYLHTLFDALPDLVWVKDPDGVYLSCNPRFERFFGKREHEIVGKTDYDFLETELADFFRKHDIAAMEAGVSRVNEEEITYADDGHVEQIETVKTPVFDSDGNTIGVLGIARDITERNEYQRELKEAKERAEESDRLKSAFLANMSHEIRTPMNAIIGFSHLLMESDLGEDEKENFAKTILSSGDHLMGLINNIIDISKLDSGEAKLKLEEVCLNELIDEVFDLFESDSAKAQSKPVSLIKDQVDDSLCIRTDRTRVRQILTNLVGNALKFTKEGWIKIGFTAEIETVLFHVSDTGIGIDESEQETVFERFRQAKIVTEKAFGGTGLGLAIAKACAKLLGGNIWLESKLGVGTTFYFTVEKKPCVESKTTIPQQRAASSSELTGTRILVAEDDLANFEYINLILKQKKMDVLRANDGEEAVRMVAEDPSIDLILMDIQMPKLNGWQATEILRSKGVEIPIIALTAFAFESDREKSLEVGCSAYLSKPLVPEKLLSTLQNFLPL